MVSHDTASLHFELAHAFVLSHAVDVAEAITHHHRGLRHGERAGTAQLKLATGKHTGFEAVDGGLAAAQALQHIHINQAVACGRIYRGCHRAHTPLDLGAGGRNQRHAGSHFDALQFC